MSLVAKPEDLAAVSLPYALTLRAIGYSLELPDVSCFELEKDGEDYLVCVTISEPARKVGFGRNLINRVAQMVWGRHKDPSSAGKLGQRLRYTPTDISELEAQAKSQRGQGNSMPDAYKLSQILRVIGDYLDRKEARAFTISMSTHSVSVWYESSVGYQNRKNFDVKHLSICICKGLTDEGEMARILTKSTDTTESPPDLSVGDDGVAVDNARLLRLGRPAQYRGKKHAGWAPIARILRCQIPAIPGPRSADKGERESFIYFLKKPEPH